MAGHSKWANIKHRKGAQDKKRGKIFTKLIREITVSARMGGGDVSANPRLRTAIDKALSQNMTRDTIDRAIKRGSGDGEADNLEEIVYEGYGPSGVAIMVMCLSDNRNRTVAEVRHAFTKSGGNLGTDGSVAYLFTKRGEISLKNIKDEELVMEVALEAGADDLVTQANNSMDVITTVDSYLSVKEALIEAGFAIDNAELTMAASTEVDLDIDAAEKLLRLIDMLEDLDDVQEVFSNAKISDEVMQALMAD